MTDAGVKLGANCWGQYTDWPALREAGIRVDTLGFAHGPLGSLTVASLLLSIGQPAQQISVLIRGSGGGDVIIDGDAACVAEPRAGEQVPLDLFFMVDKSGSMTCPVGQPGMNCTNGQMPPPAVNRWTSIKEALVGFAPEQHCPHHDIHAR
mgnify:CR=1 FL=1